MKHSQLASSSSPPQPETHQLLCSNSLVSPPALASSLQTHRVALRVHTYTRDLLLLSPPEMLADHREQSQHDALFSLQARALEKSTLAYPDVPPLSPSLSAFSKDNDGFMTLPPAILCTHAPHALHPRCVRCGGALYPLIQPNTPQASLACLRCEKLHDPEEKPSILKNTLQRDVACQNCPHKEDEHQDECRPSSSFFTFSKRPFFLVEKAFHDLESYRQQYPSLDTLWDIAVGLLECTQKLHRIGLSNVVPNQFSHITLGATLGEKWLPRFLPSPFFFDEIDIVKLSQISPPTSEHQNTLKLPIQRQDLHFHDTVLDKDKIFFLHRQQQEINPIIQQLRIGDSVGLLGQSGQIIVGSIQKWSAQQQKVILTFQLRAPVDPSELPARNQTIPISAFINGGYQRDLDTLNGLIRQLFCDPFSPETSSASHTIVENQKTNRPLYHPQLSSQITEEIEQALTAWPRSFSSEKTRKQDALDQIDQLKKRLLSIQQRSRIARSRIQHKEIEQKLRDFQALQDISSRAEDFFIPKEQLQTLEEDILLDQGMLAQRICLATQIKIQTLLQHRQDEQNKRLQQAEEDHVISKAEKTAFTTSLPNKETTHSLAEMVQFELKHFSEIKQTNDLIEERYKKRAEFETELQQCLETLQTKDLQRTGSQEVVEMRQILAQEAISLKELFPQNLDIPTLKKRKETISQWAVDAKKEKHQLVEQVHNTQRQLNLLPCKSYGSDERKKLNDRCESLKHAIRDRDFFFPLIKKMHQSILQDTERLHQDILKKQASLDEQIHFFEYTAQRLSEVPLSESILPNYAAMQQQTKALRLLLIEESIDEVENAFPQALMASKYTLRAIFEDRKARLHALQQNIEKRDQENAQPLLESKARKALELRLESLKNAQEHFFKDAEKTAEARKLLLHQFLLADQSFLSSLVPQETALLQQEATALLEEIERIERTTKISSHPDLYQQLMDVQEKTQRIRKENQNRYTPQMRVALDSLCSQTKEIERQGNSWLRTFKGLFSS